MAAEREWIVGAVVREGEKATTDVASDAKKAANRLNFMVLFSQSNAQKTEEKKCLSPKML